MLAHRVKSALQVVFGAGSPEGSTWKAIKAIRLCHSLLSERGEVSGVKIAGEILDFYTAMNAENRAAFFDELAGDFSPDPEAVGKAGEAYRLEPSAASLARLQEVVESPRQELFRRLNTAPGATAMLVALRGELFADLAKHGNWEPVAGDLGHLFTSWFNPGFLTLRQIDWDSPASILEKVIAHEAVHEIQGFSDLRRRLAADRRCYAFFHPALPDEPIIFIEIALTRDLADRVQVLLDPKAPIYDPSLANSAIFYSITNCLDGLRGVPFGSFLIKQVVEDLRSRLPNLRRFATLSPVPGFAAWLKKQARYKELEPLLAQPEWFTNRELAGRLENELVPLCARYLLRARSGKEPADPVARFHLRNGAELERIDWLGDVSPAGMQRSFGLMANYVYRLPDIERNHELYTREYRVTAAPSIRSMVRMAEQAPAE